MKPVVGGYTVLEVMLFLAVSMVLLAISNVVIQNQSAHTEFVTSMNDVNSKMQQWIDQVKNGYSATSASSSNAATSADAIKNYVCNLDGVTQAPVLTPGTVATQNTTGTNLNCIFLGKVLMVNDSTGSGPRTLNNTIYAYTVIGRRSFDDSGAPEPVNTLKIAKPTAAVYPVNSGNPQIKLIEAYKIPNGARVKHVWTDNTAASQTKPLAGFFIDPLSASNSILSVSYPLRGNIDTGDWASTAWDIPKCISLNLNSQGCNDNAATPPNLWPMDTWNICFESTRNSERALLQVLSPNGAMPVTKLQLGVGVGLCD